MDSNSTVNKLIILYVFDNMEMPMTEETVLAVCCQDNEWMSYMDCKEALPQLLDAGLLGNTQAAGGKPLFTITPDGAQCLAHFYSRINLHVREQIKEFVNQNRLQYRKKQEYFSDYYKNNDGTYSVLLKINDATTTIMELKLVVASRNTAKWIYKNWSEKASQIYGQIHEILID